jgi:regulator of protease activity HflC (stomatin/prohibitin superfamily)
MTAKTFEVLPSVGPGPRFVRGVLIAVVLLVLLVIGGPITVVPAGHVGVKDFFGNVSPNALPAGVHIILPFTRVHKMSIQTQEVKETAEVPSKEGLVMDLEGSLLFRLDPTKAAEIYRTVGVNYPQIIVVPQIRSAIREITASYEAKAMYSAEREQIARETFELFQKMSAGRGGVIAEAVLLRKIGLPPIVANAIQEKLKREQEAEQMKFVLQKEQQEAERKRIEAQGVADFQRIVAQGISPQLLEWKGIEATEKLAMSPNTKIVVVGNPKSGLPIILGGGGN